MRRDRVMRIVRDPSSSLVLLAAMSMICVCATSTAPLRYGDLGWQVWIGETILRSHHVPTSLGPETFTAAGAPWMPQEWLFAVAATSTENAIGAVVFAVFIGSLVSLAICTAAYRTWERSHSRATLPVAIVLISAMILPFDSLRAEYIAWLLLAIALLIIESGSTRLMIALLPLCVLWANIHASVVLLPILLLIRALACALDDGPLSANVGSSLAYAAATLLCSWINPVGARLTTYAIGLPLNAEITTHILEWQQPKLTNPIFVLVLTLLVYGIAGTVKRRKWWDMLLLCAFGYLTFRAGRHIALFAVAAAPAAIAAFSPKRSTVNLARLNRLWLRRYAVTLSAIYLTAIPFYLLFISSNGEAKTTAPYAAVVDAVLSLPGDHRVFCEDFAWCSLIVGRPHFTVWWDGRADAYPPQVWRQALEIVANRPTGASERNLDEYGVDIVIVKDQAPLKIVLANSSNWHRVMNSLHYVLFRRR